jgi:predicted RNase H-like HicB family nuclease
MVLHVVLEQGEDGWIVASVPALPGCHTQGRTRDEALANVHEAVRGWLESQDDPKPDGDVEIVQIAV